MSRWLAPPFFVWRSLVVIALFTLDTHEGDADLVYFPAGRAADSYATPTFSPSTQAPAPDTPPKPTTPWIQYSSDGRQMTFATDTAAPSSSVIYRYQWRSGDVRLFTTEGNGGLTLHPTNFGPVVVERKPVKVCISSRYNGFTALSREICSNSFTPKTTVSPDFVVLREGTTGEIDVTINYSPFYWINNEVDETTSIRLRAELQRTDDEWGCETAGHSWVNQLAFDASPTAIDEELSKYVTVNNCGLVIERWGQDVGQPIRLKFYGKVDGRVDGAKERVVRVVASKQQKGEMIEAWLGQVIVTIVDADERHHVCQSTLDPHVRQFNGMSPVISSQWDGMVEEFLLYQNEKERIQVNVRQMPCYPGSISVCNCGVAILCDDDLRVISRCPSERCAPPQQCPLRASLAQNGNLTVGFDLTAENDGNKYTVSLPTGGKVHVLYGNAADLMFYVDVYIEASGLDKDETLGLCGVYTGNGDDDVRNDMISWSVPRSQTLWRTPNVSSQNSRSDMFWCDCVQDKPAVCGSLLHITPCPSHSENTDGADTGQESHKRRKRSIDKFSATVLDKEVGFSPDTISREKRSNVIIANMVMWPLANGLSEADVWNMCNTSIIGHTAGQKCQDLLEESYTEDINNCVYDVGKTGIVELVDQYVEKVKTSCALTSSSLISDPVVLADLHKYLCPNDCSQNGVCDGGLCECGPGWKGASCSVHVDDPPVLLPQPPALCDISTQSCDEPLIVFGDAFLDGESLSCHYKRMEIDDDDYMLTADYLKWSTVNATYGNINFVTCPLRGQGIYQVAISNNGVNMSHAYILLVVRDAVCHRCNVYDDTFYCAPAVTGCYISGVCHRNGSLQEDEECYHCHPPTSVNDWTQIQNCSATPSRIIKVVFIVIALLLVLILAMCIVMLAYESRIRHRNRMCPGPRVFPPRIYRFNPGELGTFTTASSVRSQRRLISPSEYSSTAPVSIRSERTNIAFYSNRRNYDSQRSSRALLYRHQNELANSQRSQRHDVPHHNHGNGVGSNGRASQRSQRSNAHTPRSLGIFTNSHGSQRSQSSNAPLYRNHSIFDGSLRSNITLYGNQGSFNSSLRTTDPIYANLGVFNTKLGPTADLSRNQLGLNSSIPSDSDSSDYNSILNSRNGNLDQNHDSGELSHSPGMLRRFPFSDIIFTQHM